MTAFPISARRVSATPKFLLTALVAGLLAWGAPAGPAHAQSGVEALSNKVDRLQRELNDLQRQVYAGDGGSSGAASSGGGQAAGDSAGMTQAAATRLQQKLSQLERAVQDLTGRMERVQYDIRQLTDRMDKRAKDVDYRLSQLEQATGVSATGNGQQTGQDGSGQNQSGQNQSGQNQSGQNQSGQSQQAQNQQSGQGGGAQQGQNQQNQAQDLQQGQQGQGQQGETLGQVSQRAVDELRQNQGNQQGGGEQSQSAGQSADQSGGGQDGGDGQQTASVNVELPDGSTQEQYEYAFGLLRQADYAKAEQALSKFLNQNPDSDLAGNAKYWLGETFYVRGNYERAAVTFAEGFQTYPESQKAPDNLLKLGMSLAQIDRTEDACGIFAELQSRYPDAKNNILQRAQREQDRLNCGQG